MAPEIDEILTAVRADLVRVEVKLDGIVGKVETIKVDAARLEGFQKAMEGSALTPMEKKDIYERLAKMETIVASQQRLFWLVGSGLVGVAVGLLVTFISGR